jgi:phospholipid-binding lipoprotein MlaA
MLAKELLMKRFLSRTLCILLLTSLFSSAALAEDVYDPIEPVNRGIFWFNQKFDYYLLEPVSRGYRYVVPDVVQDGVGNFFSNLKYPVNLFSDIVQLKFKLALTHTGRFVVNTTAGLLGTVDVAKHMGMANVQEEDFGQALGYYGVPPGPYIVLPIFGPSNLRDVFGLAVDSFLDPIYWAGPATNMNKDDALALSLGLKSLYAIDKRSSLDDAIKAAKEASLDYYLFMQGAYTQYRRGQIYDGHPPAEPGSEDEDGGSGPDVFTPKPRSH